MAFVPKNKAEAALQRATLLRYRLEDFAARHPEATELCAKTFVGAMYALQTAEYAAAAVTTGPFGVAGKFAFQESASYAIDRTIDEASMRSAQLITSSATLQQEFADTIKVCTYAGLCVGSVKAGKTLVKSIVKKAGQAGGFRGIRHSDAFSLFRSSVGSSTEAGAAGAARTGTMTRIDVIHEPEMIETALSAPTEWKGQFKLVRELSQSSGNAEISRLYSREVLFKDPRSGQMFRVLQRNDIDPNYVIKSGTTREIGRTNLELMLEGRAPYTNSGEKVIIHHMGQDAFGPFVEVTKRTHKPFLHNQFGYGQPHPTNPVVRTDFDPIREAYWRAYAEQFK